MEWKSAHKNSTNNNFWHEQPKVREGDQFQVPGSNPVQEWHLLSRSLHQNCLSNGQTKQDLVVNAISFANKFKLYKSLVNSILLYGCETWTLLADSEKRIQTFETKFLRKLLSISFLEHKMNGWVRSKINFLLVSQEPLLVTVKRRKLAWFGHVTRHDSLFKTILQGIMESGQCCGWHRKCWMDDIKD